MNVPKGALKKVESSKACRKLERARKFTFPFDLVWTTKRKTHVHGKETTLCDKFKPVSVLDESDNFLMARIAFVLSAKR